VVLAYSQTVYDWLKLGHVLAAVIWVGGDVMILILSIRVLREADPQREAAFVHDLGQIGKTILGPVSGLLMIFAIALVIYAPQWNFSDLWIELAIAGYIATFITGVFVLGPSAEKIDRMIASGSAPDDPEVRSLIRRTMRTGRIDVVVLVLVVCDMVLKPGS
jgi:uncharacterized membrane protein